MNLAVKIGSRASALALVQVEEILNELKSKNIHLDVQLVKYSTSGDVDKTTPLTAGVADNFFTDKLDHGLLNGEIDLAIHSAKDLPQSLPKGLSIFALTKGLDDKDAWVGDCHFKDLPVGAKVGTSSVLRQSQVKALRPDLQIVDIRGTIAERLDLVAQKKVHGIIVAACALKRLGLEEKIKDLLPWDGMPLQGQLAVVGRQKDFKLRSLLQQIDVRLNYGKVILAGAGPGDPDLITVKAIKALESADCVFYDFLADKQLLRYAPDAEQVYVGKRKGDHSMPQSDLSRLLKVRAMEGKNVVRLKGGDPLIFGRGSEEIQYLRSYHIDVDVIPGVSSATGIPASLQIPLTSRFISSSVAFVTGHEGEHQEAIRVPDTETIVYLMGLTRLSQILEGLRKKKWDKNTPIMIIANGTRANEHIVKATLSTIEEMVAREPIHPPALIIVGRTLDLYKEHEQPTFLYCGTHPNVYQRLGKIIHFPMIEIKPIAFPQSVKDQLKEKTMKADLIMCTSPYAVQHFVPLLDGINLSGRLFAAIGRQTHAAFKSLGIHPNILAIEENAQGMLQAILKHLDVKDKHVLFPRSSLPNPFLKDALTAQGAQVEEIPVYQNVKPMKRPLPDEFIQGVIFTSPSTVRNFLEDYGKIPRSWKVLARGPLTLKTLKDAGYTYASEIP